MSNLNLFMTLALQVGTGLNDVKMYLKLFSKANFACGIHVQLKWFSLQSAYLDITHVKVPHDMTS